MKNTTTLPTWTAILISLASLAVSFLAVVNAQTQTTTAQQALETANEQLATAKAAHDAALAQLAIAEKNYKLAEKALALQNSLAEQDNGFPFVFNQDFLDAIDGTIANHASFSLNIFNKTKRAYSYRVSVESEGFTVFWPNLVPKSAQNLIHLDRNSTIVSPEAAYTGSFVVWHHQTPAPAATLRIKVNGSTVLSRQYTYDTGRKVYTNQAG